MYWPVVDFMQCLKVHTNKYGLVRIYMRTVDDSYI